MSIEIMCKRERERERERKKEKREIIFINNF